jgi:hypothetical protein
MGFESLGSRSGSRSESGFSRSSSSCEENGGGDDERRLGELSLRLLCDYLIIKVNSLDCQEVRTAGAIYHG